MKITVVGMGYVGLSNALLLAQYNKITALDSDAKKIDLLNMKKSPIEDKEIVEFLKRDDISFEGTIDKNKAYKDAEFVIIATPTDYNTETNYFDTSSIEKVLEDIQKVNQEVVVVIKSTVPIGYTSNIRNKFSIKNIIFSPEFLREGKALHDNLYPSRIVIGSKSKEGERFAELLQQGSIKKDIPVLFTSATEAEAIKLFSNTYLAMRVSFFNELDTYAHTHNLSAKDIINGISLDPRIGNHYNNPSFGYGGYCLPKDTKQLLANYIGIPNELIQSITKANDTRKEFIAESIISMNVKMVGIYRLSMKKDSDNFRDSALLDIISYLKKSGISIIIYEPIIKEKLFLVFEVENSLSKFKEKSDIVVANRIDDNILDIKDKIFTRDIFNKD